MTKRQRIEQALAERFEFRYNVLTGGIDYRRKNSLQYLHHTNYVMNSIIREIDKHSADTITESMYYSIIMSDFTESYHPVQHYFNVHLAGLGETSSTEHIERLAATVTVPDPQTWYLSLKRWLVASVANGLTEVECQNHTCIVMTGGMGLFKTTWLSMLCPPSLAPDLIMTGKVDLNLGNKDTFMLLATKFIINLDDQLRNLMKKDSETMKTLITHPEVSVRRPFAKFSETLARMANFLASINGDEFMAEHENRRFLPFRVQAININGAKAIDMNNVWHEAYCLWKTGLILHKQWKDGDEAAGELFNSKYRYWWTKEELDEAFPDMQSFAFAGEEMEHLTSFFKIPKTKEEANVTMNSSEIQAFIRSKTGIQLSSNKIGKALKTLEAIELSVRTGKVVVKKYALIEIDRVREPERLMKDQETQLKKTIFK
ncbi:MAG: VapE domain-containing protein [Dyadobacter sp.]|uniref:VapE domain-containing protein n=1 Tax=Dyadobacter sp. TaxID=1914288 RepID=UPI003265CFC4